MNSCRYPYTNGSCNKTREEETLTDLTIFRKTIELNNYWMNGGTYSTKDEYDTFSIIKEHS